MSNKIKINQGGEGEWKIPRENETNVLGKVKIPFDEGEDPRKFDSSEIEVSKEAKEKIGEFFFERRLAQEAGRKVLKVVGKEI